MFGRLLYFGTLLFCTTLDPVDAFGGGQGPAGWSVRLKKIQVLLEARAL